MKNLVRAALSVLIATMTMHAAFAGDTTVRVENRVFRTYPFGDPSPVPGQQRIYPYFRFDGYTDTSEEQTWSFVVLENPYLRVLVAPQIGGKIWSAVEKKTGRPFIYHNHVVKFRDVAMRGPWTSGGIEFNFGAIGHAPTTATPVDYAVRENGDGSASCIVGALDLASRTEWRVEIRLPGDAAYFETRAFWYNPTETQTSLYHWMNASVDAREDLAYIFPGHFTIGHGGDVHPWPVHANGKRISVYGQNDFGSYKSYHVIGSLTDFWGGIYERDRFGFGHWSLYGDKPGKKIWIWGLSEQGRIWEKILTDPELGNRQYTEIQSGLLFNQAGSGSSRTPFKHRFFPSDGVERFTEVWFPVLGLGGMVDANRHGALNVTREGHVLRVELCALRRFRGPVSVSVGDEAVVLKTIDLRPLDVFQDSVLLDAEQDFKVDVGDGLLTAHSRMDEHQRLQRPAKADTAFEWGSPFGMYTSGIEKARQRNYRAAMDDFIECLEAAPYFTPALVGAARIAYRRMEYERASEFIRRALSHDAYDPEANFAYGTIQRRLGNAADARDGFGIAARSMTTRAAAYRQLAEMEFLDRDFEGAERYARLALDYNRYHIGALKLLVLTSRKMGLRKRTETVLDSLLRLDPLNHFALYERFRVEPKPETRDRFRSMIRNEFPQESYLELAVDYADLGLVEEAVDVLEMSPPHPIVSLWLAYLYDRQDAHAESRAALASALQASPLLVFPFRPETVRVLEWAGRRSGDWKIAYYRALIYWSRDRMARAENDLLSCGDRPEFASFYLLRGDYRRDADPVRAMKEYMRALELDRDTWRAYVRLVRIFSDEGETSKALEYARIGAERFPGNQILQHEYARALLHGGAYERCLKILEQIHILPHEGARYGRDTYRQACVLHALTFIDSGQYTECLKWIERARLWPENLGAGRPYDVDMRIEDFIAAVCYERLGDRDKADELRSTILAYSDGHRSVLNANLYIHATVLKQAGRSDEAGRILDAWLEKAPDSVAARWSRASFYGRRKEADALMRSEHTGVGTPWNLVIRDPHFRLVVQLENSIHR